MEGDCVVPMQCALLDNATHVILPGIFHSMSRVGSFSEKEQVRLWYGSDAVVDEWLCHMES